MSKLIACTHCNLDFEESYLIQEENYYFCCKGCQSVFHLLKDNGLSSFYDKVGDVTLTPQNNTYEDSSNFDVASFYEKYVKVNKDGFSEVSLIIEGIHCSACVWLNEKALQKMDGILEANINFTNNKASIVWVDSLVKLSQIIEMIRAVGYNAFAYDSQLQELGINAKRKEYYMRLVVALFASMNIMMIAVAQYAGYFTGMTQSMKNILNTAEWILSTPVLFYSGWIFFRGAYYGMKNKIVNMDILVATGAFLTYVYSIYVTVFELGEAYFDSVSMIITFVLIGKFLEVLSKKSIVDTLDVLTKQIPSEVNILKDEKIVSCLVANVQKGDIVIVSCGEKVLFDGEVVQGEGFFDESSLTGESEPIYKSVGSRVLSATVSIDADIHLRASKDFEHSIFSSLISLLESAINKKPRIEELANKLSQYFSSVILGLAFFTFLVWWLWPHSFEISFMVGISVIIIACPCALALATPLATLVGLSLAAQRGILFKQAAQLETMAKVDTLVMDKTGTLTIGKPKVIKETIYKEFDKSILFSLVKASKHPVAKGIFECIQREGMDEYIFDEYSQVPATGIEARYNSVKILGGNLKLLEKYNISFSYESENTIFCFSINNEVVAVYELNDSIKENAQELIRSAKKNKIEVIILSGDNEKVVKRVAIQIGVQNYESNLTPEDKLHSIQRLQNNGRKVVMVGDGVNDILALANADIGIVMGSGSDIAVDVGDVVLLNNSLSSLDDAFKISRTSYGLIKQNLGISLVYNAITIPLAMAGFIIPFIAAISMSLSSLLVVGNSIRIRYKWKQN